MVVQELWNGRQKMNSDYKGRGTHELNKEKENRSVWAMKD